MSHDGNAIKRKINQSDSRYRGLGEESKVSSIVAVGKRHKSGITVRFDNIRFRLGVVFWGAHLRFLFLYLIGINNYIFMG